MTNKDWFDFQWGEYMSYAEFVKLIEQDVRPVAIMKRIPMTNTTFHNWKRKVLSELKEMPRT